MGWLPSEQAGERRRLVSCVRVRAEVASQALPAVLGECPAERRGDLLLGPGRDLDDGTTHSLLQGPRGHVARAGGTHSAEVGQDLLEAGWSDRCLWRTGCGLRLGPGGDGVAQG
jgi:hypothetical protein